MKLVFSTSTFLALSAAGMTSASDSLRGASPTLDQEAPRLQRALMGSCGAACDAINGASQYACEPHATMDGLSVCSFGVQTDSLTSDPASGAVFNRVQFQNVGAMTSPSGGMTDGGGGITSSNGGDGTGGAGCAVNGSPVIQASNGAVTTGQMMTGGIGSSGGMMVTTTTDNTQQAAAAAASSGGGGITSSNGGDSSTTGGAGCAVNGSPVIQAGNSGAVTTGQMITGGAGSGSTLNTGGSSSNNGGYPTEAEQNTVGGSASDRPPAAGGNYDSQDTLPENTPQLCVTNAVSATCPAGTQTPDIACCASKVTGAFFNACCPSGFQGIQMGSGTNTNQFDMNMLMGTGVEAAADCVVNANRRGCQIFDVPGNEANQQIVLPAGVSGACEYVTAGTTCAAGYTSGTCTAAGNTSPVCCPPCATGTYLPGNACLVILPDPAACGFNIVGATTTDNTQQAAAAAASGGTTGGTTGGGMTSSSGGDSSSTSGGAGCAVVAQPAAVTVTTVPRIFGTTGTGGTCKSDNDCLQNLLCISRNGGLCATMGSCYNDNDCQNPNNLGWSVANCDGPKKCGGVVCKQDCSAGSSSTSATTTTTTTNGVVNTGVGSGGIAGTGGGAVTGGGGSCRQERGD